MWWFFEDGLFGIFFVLIFAVVLCGFVYIIVSGVRQWKRNNDSPRLTVDAQVVAKRTDVTHHHDAGHGMGHASTWYYATFQVDSGDRMEFSVGGSEYGMLAEGDYGRLTFQGTRYLGFERRR